jgi:hypothetical protein
MSVLEDVNDLAIDSFFASRHRIVEVMRTQTHTFTFVIYLTHAHVFCVNNATGASFTHTIETGVYSKQVKN